MENINKVNERGGQRGFSLTELLVVIAIMTLLVVASVPAINALSGSGRVNQTVAEVSGMLEQARQYAVAQSTYVYVAFYTDDTAEKICVAILGSKDGTEPASLNDTVPSTTAKVDLLSRVRTFERVTLPDTVDVPAPNLPSGGTIDHFNTSASFSIKVPWQSSAVSFKKVIIFTPTGQARNGSTPIEALDFGLQPVKGNVKNAALIRVNGLTGEAVVYRN